MAHRGAFYRHWQSVAVALLLSVFAAQLLWVADRYSPNWDEAHHLYDGYKVLTSRDYRANAEVPPLLKIAAALPLLGMHPVMPAHEGNSQSQSAFLEGRTFLVSNGGDRLLLPARCMCMLFTLALAGLVYAAARHLFGQAAGLLALTLFVLDPLLLAHGTLISTDVASALFLFATVFAWYRYTERTSVGWLLATGMLAGCALVTKYTGILVVPMLVLLAGFEAVQVRSSRRLLHRMVACAAVLLTAWGVIWFFYGFRDAPAAAGLQLSPQLGPYLAGLPGKGNGAVLGLVAKLHLLPQAYVWGLANTKYTEFEFVSYFCGRIYRHGPRMYFPVAFLIKSTLPFLLLLLAAPFAWRAKNRSGVRKVVFLALPVVLYFMVIATSYFQIGARHMMPMYPFLYVVAGASAAALLRRGPVWVALVVLLCVWQAETSLHVAPNYMAYGNEAMGGPLQVRRYLGDANVDWGQQLKTVRQYLQSNHISNCWFAYFPDGAVQPQDYGVHCKRLPTGSGTWWFHLPMDVPAVVDGTVLISESDLDGIESGDGSLNPYDSFHSVPPVAVLQDGVYVYQGRFAIPLAASWYQVRLSGDLAVEGKSAEALDAARLAVNLAPQSARAQVRLASLLSAAGQWAEAEQHYREAEREVAQQRPDLQEAELGPAIRKGLADAQEHLPAHP